MSLPTEPKKKIPAMSLFTEPRIMTQDELDDHSGKFRSDFQISGQSIVDDLLGFFISDLDDFRTKPDGKRGMFITYGLNGKKFQPIIELYDRVDGEVRIKKGDARLAMNGRWLTINEDGRSELEQAYRTGAMVDEGNGTHIPVNSPPGPNAFGHPYGACYDWGKIDKLIADNLPNDADRSKYRLIIACTSFSMPPTYIGDPALHGNKADDINRHLLALYIARREGVTDHRILSNTHTNGYALRAVDYGGACPPNIPSRV